MTIERMAVVTLLFPMRKGIPPLFAQYLPIIKATETKRGICVERWEESKVSSYSRCH